MIFALSRTEVQNVHAVFERDPEILHVLNDPLPSFLRMIFIPLELWDPFRPKKKQKKKTKTNTCRKNKKKTEYS